jgi:hypothetical protein
VHRFSSGTSQSNLLQSADVVSNNKSVIDRSLSALNDAIADSPAYDLINSDSNGEGAGHAGVLAVTPIPKSSVPYLTSIDRFPERRTEKGLALLDPMYTGHTPFADKRPGLHLAMAAPHLATKSKVRFGMMAAADVNTLFFPEQRFYSQGRSITFSEKEIVAGGYSAGASLLFDMHKFIVETGLVYSSKTFGPGRKLFIGSTADRHSLDFENITLNIVSLPLYMHWKLDGHGMWRIYATGGASLHVIANANYDLIVEDLFASSAAPPDPLQLQNEKEVKRVREHMLDGAKFRSKAYVTAAAGFGIERYLNSRMSIYLQPMYHYQISFFGLIDQNGKHLQNGSLLLGTRITL